MENITWNHGVRGCVFRSRGGACHSMEEGGRPRSSGLPVVINMINKGFCTIVLSVKHLTKWQ